MSSPHSENTVLRERYKITQIVGQGGMGCVYRAEDLRLPGRLCALKEVLIDSADSDEMRQQTHAQFLREASILAQLDHPNLPKVSDFFTENDREYLVMDYVPGNDLKQMIDASIQQGETLPIETVLDWSEQLLDAVIYLHKQEQPVLHRDIKPANIKLTLDGRIKLVDFGLVKLLSEDESRTLTMVQGRGTAIYTPLEQYGGDGGHTDVRSDIYSLGATIYHLVTCKAPPEAKARFLNPRILLPPHDLNPAVITKFSDGILWAMEMHPANRPNSAKALRDVLFGDDSAPLEVDLTMLNKNSAVFDALNKNKVILGVIFILFLLAFYFTLF